MLLAVMEKMAALTKRSQIARAVVGRIVIDVRCRQNHLGLLEPPQIVTIIEPSDHPALPVPPELMLGIEPAAITEMADDLAMGPGASLASPFGVLKPNDRRELLPVDRIEASEVAPNRHPLPFRLGQARLGLFDRQIEIRKRRHHGKAPIFFAIQKMSCFLPSDPFP